MEVRQETRNQYNQIILLVLLCEPIGFQFYFILIEISFIQATVLHEIRFNCKKLALIAYLTITNTQQQSVAII